MSGWWMMVLNIILCLYTKYTQVEMSRPPPLSLQNMISLKPRKGMQFSFQVWCQRNRSIMKMKVANTKQIVQNKKHKDLNSNPS